jgi:hypothetical protein
MQFKKPYNLYLDHFLKCLILMVTGERIRFLSLTSFSAGLAPVSPAANLLIKR